MLIVAMCEYPARTVLDISMSVYIDCMHAAAPWTTELTRTESKQTDLNTYKAVLVQCPKGRYKLVRTSLDRRIVAVLEVPAKVERKSHLPGDMQCGMHTFART